MRVTPDGDATITEINDSPVEGSDDNAPMPEEDLPDLDAATSDIMKPPGGAPGGAY